VTTASDLLGEGVTWARAEHPHAAHLERTLFWTRELDPEASGVLQLAALLHDIERAVPDPGSPFDSARDWSLDAYVGAFERIASIAARAGAFFERFAVAVCPVAPDVAPPLGTFAFPYLLVGFAFLVGRPVARAIAERSPRTVQRAVKRCVLGLVVLDAVLATMFVGLPGVLVLLLLPPALLLGKWVYST